MNGIYKAGREACFNGVEQWANPWPEGSEYAAAWNAGYEDAIQQLYN